MRGRSSGNVWQVELFILSSSSALVFVYTLRGLSSRLVHVSIGPDRALEVVHHSGGTGSFAYSSVPRSDVVGLRAMAKLKRRSRWVNSCETLLAQCGARHVGGEASPLVVGRG